MRPVSRTVAGLAALLMAASCASTAPPPTTAILSENQILDLIKHPRRWDGRIVTVRLYPYDLGGGPNVVCFEPCDRAYAERSPFLLYASAGRHRGLSGNTPVVVTATYSSTCAYRRELHCLDLFSGVFTEMPSQVTGSGGTP
jgi:hypothetical protein